MKNLVSLLNARLNEINCSNIPEGVHEALMADLEAELKAYVARRLSRLTARRVAKTFARVTSNKTQQQLKLKLGGEAATLVSNETIGVSGQKVL